MKSTLLFPFLILVFTGFAQEAPENANEIVMATDWSPEQAYESMTKDLLMEGFSLKFADEDEGIITTLPFTVRWGFIDADVMQVSFTCRLTEINGGTEVSISGRLGLGIGKGTYPSIPISNTGEENSATLTSWRMMKDVADGVPSEQQYYRVNPNL